LRTQKYQNIVPAAKFQSVRFKSMVIYHCVATYSLCLFCYYNVCHSSTIYWHICG